jgi:hypothetical protein
MEREDLNIIIIIIIIIIIAIFQTEPYYNLLQDKGPSFAHKTKTKLRDRSPQANYTDQATAACRRS